MEATSQGALGMYFDRILDSGPACHGKRATVGANAFTFFELSSMSALPFTQNQTSIVATAAHLANQFRSRSFPRSSEFPTEELQILIRAGLLGIVLPSHLGGLALGQEPGLRAVLLRVLKEIGRGNLPLGRLFEGHVNALLLLEEFGSLHQIARIAEDVMRHDAVLGVWNTGPHGSPQLTPLANGSYQLSGSKTFATGAARIQKAIVTAGLPDGGWQMCLVPLAEEGIHIRTESWNPLGMEASESFTVEFSQTQLAPDALVGRPGDYYAEPTFTAGAFRFSAVHLGGAQALFDSCIEFVHSSSRANDPFQRQRIGQMAVLLESGRQWLAQAGEWLENSLTDFRHLAAHAQMMRIATEEICTRIIHLVQLSVGARGLTVPEPFARTLRDLQMYLRQAGFDEAFQAIARHALQEHSASG